MGTRKSKPPVGKSRHRVTLKSDPSPMVPLAGSAEDSLGISWGKWVFWAAFSFTLLGFQTHRWMVPGVHGWPIPSLWQLLLVFLVGMVVSTKYSPKTGASSEDLSEKTAKRILYVVLGIGILVRFFGSSSPIGSFCFDGAVEPETTLRAVELGDYRNAFEGQYMNGVNPLHQWVLIVLWFLKPSATVFMAERWVGTAAFAATLLFLYLAGKEAVDRRVGVFALVLGLVCKPLILKSMSCLHADSVALVTALVVWRFFALTRRPDATRFLIWGAVTGFGVYCYTPYRLLIPFFVLSALVWILVEQKDRGRFEGATGSFAKLTLFLFAVYVWYTYVGFRNDNWFSRAVDLTGSWLPCMVLAAMVFWLFRWGPRLMEGEKSRLLLYWAGAVWVCVFVAQPLMTNPYIQYLMLYASEHQGFDFHPLKSLVFLFDKPLINGDQLDLSITNDSFFGYFEIVFAALGIALVLARPNWVGVFLLAAVVVGMSPHVLTREPNSLRITFCAPPFLLLGALGLNDVWNSWQVFFRGGKNRLLVAGFLVLAVVAGWTTYQRVMVQWAEGSIGRDVCIYRRALEDQKRGDRVFMGPQLQNAGLYPLFEERPVYLLREKNVLYFDPAVPGWNAVVYLSFFDQDVKNKISALDPSVVWETLTTLYDGNPAVQGYRCVLPFERLQAGLGDFMRVVRVEKPYWRRDYLRVHEQSYRPALIQEEDLVKDASSPSPHAMDNEAVQYNRVVHVEQEGDYELEVVSSDRVVAVDVDGKARIRLVHSLAGRFSGFQKDDSKRVGLHLEKGDHAMRVVVFTESDIPLPGLRLRSKSKEEKTRSLWDLSDRSVTDGI